MDSLNGGLEQSEIAPEQGGNLLFVLGDNHEPLVADSARHLAIPEHLFKLEELDILYESSSETLWTYMHPAERPSFSLTMLSNFYDWQRLIGEGFGPGKVPLSYVVLASRTPGVFSLGGDLELFQGLIRAQNREGLIAYGNRCVEILDRIMRAFEQPLITIGLVQDAALGGGFEAVLAYDKIIAERGSTFGLPEVIFGLFPGMGAHSILSRKLGTAMADRLILSNEIYTAEQMYDLGIVHQLAEPGEGLKACREFIEKSQRRHSGMVRAHEAMRISAPVPLDEMKRIVDLWADAALELREQDLKVMSRLARAQAKLAHAA
jgi:DSF synthase